MKPKSSEWSPDASTVSIIILNTLVYTLGALVTPDWGGIFESVSFRLSLLLIAILGSIVLAYTINLRHQKTQMAIQGHQEEVSRFRATLESRISKTVYLLVHLFPKANPDGVEYRVAVFLRGRGTLSMKVVPQLLYGAFEPSVTSETFERRFGIVGMAWQTEQTVIANGDNAGHNTRYRLNRYAITRKCGSALATPIRTKDSDSIQGILYVDSKEDLSISQLDRPHIQQIAENISTLLALTLVGDWNLEDLNGTWI